MLNTLNSQIMWVNFNKRVRVQIPVSLMKKKKEKNEEIFCIFRARGNHTHLGISNHLDSSDNGSLRWDGNSTQNLLKIRQLLMLMMPIRAISDPRWLREDPLNFFIIKNWCCYPFVSYSLRPKRTWLRSRTFSNFCNFFLAVILIKGENRIDIIFLW